MRRPRNWRKALLSVAVVAGCVLFAAAPQPSGAQSAEPGGNNSASAPAAAPAPLSPSDPDKQIDELMRECDRYMNVSGQFQKVVECTQQALALSEKSGDKRRAAMARVYLGAALAAEGKLTEAIEVAKKGVDDARDSGDKRALEQALNTEAGCVGESGRYEEALDLFYEIHDIARATGDQTMEYMSLLNIGEAYTRSGEPEHAGVPLQEALRIAAQLKRTDANGGNPSKKGTEMALLNLGAMELEQSRYTEALNYYERVHLSRPQSPLWQITALEGMARAHQHLGQPQLAIDLFEEAILAASKTAGALLEARLLSELGTSQEAVGKLDAALATENKSLAIIRANGGDPDLEWEVEGRIGHSLRGMGRNAEALDHYQTSIKGIESLRSVAIETEEGRAGVLARSRAVYAETADLLAEEHRDIEAFEIAERGRARAFVEMLATIRGGLPDEMTPEQAQNESDLQARISSIQKELWKEGVSAREEQEQKAKLASAEDDLEAFHASVRRSNPRYASIRYPEPINAGQVQSELLDNKSVLLEFMLGEKRSLVWVVSRDKLTCAVLPPRMEIEKRVLEFRKALTDKTSVLTAQSAIAKTDRLGSALYSTLFGPIRYTIPSGAGVIVVPDGILSYLPFETLLTGTRRNTAGQIQPVYALEKYRISYVPSANALAAVQSLNAQRAEWEKTLLAFGDPIVEGRSAPASPRNKLAEVRASTPDSSLNSEALQSQAAYEAYSERGFSLERLPFTRQEVLGIGKLFPSAQRQLYLGESATEDAIKKERLDNYRYIHLASHGYIDESVPGRSGILFSRDPASREDGVLQEGEIMRLRFSADLVTLSACSTGLGKFVNGEGILGLTRALFYAGARNVVVSLWNVNDSATAELMRSFYASLNRGESKSEALRSAKLALLDGSDPTWRHPHFWAAFVLVGNGQ